VELGGGDGRRKRSHSARQHRAATNLIKVNFEQSAPN
jgi:hypothetical protein